MSQLSAITGNNQICILLSLFKGHTSIPWIQISMEKAYQSNFAQLSSHPPDRTGMKQTMLKAILPPFLWPMKEWWATTASYSMCRQCPESLMHHPVIVSFRSKVSRNVKSQINNNRVDFGSITSVLILMASDFKLSFYLTKQVDWEHV